MVYIKLKRYLDDLEVEELLKSPDDRLPVPNLSTISRDTGIHYTTLSRMANRHTKRFDFETADKIIKSIRKHGFDMQISDLIDFKDN